MKSYDINEAALFLKMSPEGVRRKVYNGEIRASKPGKRWCISEDDLADYYQSKYAIPAKALQGVIYSDRRKTWHSTKETTFGGLKSATLVDEYNAALGQQIKR